MFLLLFFFNVALIEKIINHRDDNIQREHTSLKNPTNLECLWILEHNILKHNHFVWKKIPPLPLWNCGP